MYVKKVLCTRFLRTDYFQIEDLACGYGFTVYAVDSKEYKLFGCGLNADSQIGKSFIYLK